MLQRNFQGSWLAVIIAAGVGVFALVSQSSSGAGAGAGIIGAIYFIACSVLYYFSSMLPQYTINRKIISGEGGSFIQEMMTSSFEEGIGPGCFGMWFVSIIIVIILPVVIIFNFVKNYGIE